MLQTNPKLRKAKKLAQGHTSGEEENSRLKHWSLLTLMPGPASKLHSLRWGHIGLPRGRRPPSRSPKGTEEPKGHSRAQH